MEPCESVHLICCTQVTVTMLFRPACSGCKILSCYYSVACMLHSVAYSLCGLHTTFGLVQGKLGQHYESCKPRLASFL